MNSTNISFEDFQKVDLRVGTIIEVSDFPKARIPAFQLKIDFGGLGIKKSSAQITSLYSKESLMNRKVVAVINFKAKQIANFKSECLVLGLQNGKDVVLLHASLLDPFVLAIGFGDRTTNFHGSDVQFWWRYLNLAIIESKLGDDYLILAIIRLNIHDFGQIWE